MRKIDALLYSTQIIRFSPLHRYLTIIINETNVSTKLKELEFDWFFETTKGFLKNKNEDSVEKYKKDTESNYAKMIDVDLKNGLKTIKNSFIVNAYSVFEIFLVHLVEVYCEYFPELYISGKVKIARQDINNITKEDIDSAFIERFVKDFSFLPFDKKIEFIKKQLKLDDAEIWILNNENCIDEINAIRNKIVHSDEEIDIEYDRCNFYFDYLNSLIFKLSTYSQYRHGIEFNWILDTNINVKMAEHPIL
jgi:hypothetical protein